MTRTEFDWLPGGDTPELEAALAYRAHGFRPIPIYAPSASGCTCRRGRLCQAAGKHPIARGWQRSHVIERTIQARWTAWPSANVGLVTGGSARLVVLDVDGPDGQRSLRELECSHEALPETLTSATGGGGEQRRLWLCDPCRPAAVASRALRRSVVCQGRVQELWFPGRPVVIVSRTSVTPTVAGSSR